MPSAITVGQESDDVGLALEEVVDVVVTNVVLSVTVSVEATDFAVVEGVGGVNGYMLVNT